MKQRRFLAPFLSTLIGVSLLAVCPVFASTKEITLINWASYMPPEVIADYEAKTGVQVLQTYYSGADMLKGMLMAGNTEYDLAVPALVDMEQEIQAGLYLPLDKSLIPNLKNANTDLYSITSKIDKNNTYGVIYSYGTTGIAYNVDKIHQILGEDVTIDSWKYLFDPKYLSKLSKCGVAFVDDPTQVFGLTLLYLGLDPNTQNPEDFRKATDYLMSIRQYLTYFNNDIYMQDMANGNICMAMAYSGDTLRIMQAAKAAHDGVNVEYAVPKEGSAIFFDMMVIPKHAAHPEEAMKFLNYLLEPKVMAQVSNYLGQPNAVPESTPYLIPELNSPRFTPNRNVAPKLFLLHDPTFEMNTFVSNDWFEVRYGVNMS
jgi:putrescine transport system substrate-binding protein